MKIQMDKKYTEEDIRACNLAITMLAEKYGALSEPMVVARCIWNIFTNANSERARGRDIIGKLLRHEPAIFEVEKKLFHPIEDVDIIS